MIDTFSDYIESYVRKSSVLGLPHRPGEHHFVATYLVPRLMEYTGIVPDFINPDGTKDVQGDIVYYRSGAHYFGIEVKFETVRLTEREFNRWIFEIDSTMWPNVFVGVGQQGFAVARWRQFRAAYIAAVRAREGEHWRPQKVKSQYGPTVKVDVVGRHLPKGTWFNHSQSGREASANESAFCAALRREVRPAAK